ncbi:hypothetical protein MTAT_19210 [Moorella thermoacetica]|uniref:Rad52/22 family double-strand break repair protein n=1 Tax=Neomoorella thermoacetica TaxID=1525 RepID=A0AAC9HIM9_NEOTH|nr:Rad52/Rad22 family DNA repair protein [Moorella thermoacetica]AOQ24578.1 Rad52/22 family double-strand break repair protein [Moorella thermoacetica]TYL12679.1 hypothetical protein MTAT_19210 [Moorella thermoacetica]
MDIDKERIIKAFSQPTNRNYIKQREVDGRTLDYIEWVVPCKIINEATQNTWDFRILQWQIINPANEFGDENANAAVFVWAELTIPGLGTRQHFGTHDIIKNKKKGTLKSNWADAFKAAVSDAFKKCANMFGIGLDLYSDVVNTVATDEYDEQDEDITVDEEEYDDDNAWDAETVERFLAIKQQLGIVTNEELNPYITEWSDGAMSSYEELTPDTLADFTDFLEAQLEQLESA